MNAGPSGPGNGVPVKIKFDRLIAYSTLQLPLAMAALPVVLNVSHFYGEVLKLSLQIMGPIFIFARVVDAIQDPVIGLISDRFTRRGRRGRLAFVALMIPVLYSVASGALDMYTLTTGCAMIVIGFQSVLFALFAQVYDTMEGLLPEDARISRLFGAWSLERGLRAGGLLAAAAVAGLAAQMARFYRAPFSRIGHDSSLWVGLLSATALILSFQVILGTFFLSILRIRWARRAGTGRVAAAELPSGFTGAELPSEPASALSLNCGL